MWDLENPPIKVVGEKYSQEEVDYYNSIRISNIYLEFINNSYDKFNSNYDISNIINNISKNILTPHSSNIYKGLRVERLLDKDTTFMIEENSEYLFPYNEQSINNIIKTNIGISSYNYKIYRNYFWEFDLDNTQYHKFCFGTYHYYQNLDLSNNNGNNTISFYNDYSNFTDYIPVLRLYRTKDEYGINNDLIFGKFNINDDNIIDVTDNDISSNNLKNIYLKNIDKTIERYCQKIENKYKYLNYFKLNIPVVGIQESLCLNMNMNIDPLKLFRNNINHYYLYSDYLFIYNDTNFDKEILLDDESLSLVNCQKTKFNIKSKELKVYYPNNFNYNATYREFNDEIYKIKFFNKSSDDVQFKIINIGNLNLDINTLYNNYIYIEDQIGYKYVCHLLYLYEQFKNSVYDDKDKYADLIRMYNDIINVRTKYKDQNNYSELKNKLEIFFNYTEQQTYEYNNIIVKEIIDDNGNKIYEYNKENNREYSNSKNPQKIQKSNKIVNINGTSQQQSNYTQIDNLNKITNLNIDHICNLSESDLVQISDNYANISIKDYSLNKAGYLIIITNK